MEEGENIVKALSREIQEEAKVSIDHIVPIALVETDFNVHKKTGILVFKAQGMLEAFKQQKKLLIEPFYRSMILLKNTTVTNR